VKLARGTVLPLIAVALIIGSVSAAYFFSLRIMSNVKVEYPSPPQPPTVKIGIYKDSSCTTALTEIDWGTLQPTQTRTYPAWIRNEGDLPVVLSLQTENWNPPEAQQYMALTWNYAGEIPVNTIIAIEFQLTVFSNITGVTNFSFDTVITAEG